MNTNKMNAIMQQIAEAEHSLKNHLITLLIEGKTLPKEALNAILKTFYADGLWWVSALGHMEKEARNPRFKQALLDNYNCETGISGNIPHLQLMENFAASIMLSIDMNDSVYTAALKRAQTENKMIKKATEPTRAGFMLATETLFPTLLQVVRPAIVQHFPMADMKYIDEHIEVDGDEHSKWMRESVEQILVQNPEYFDEVMRGVTEAIHGALFPLTNAVTFVPNPEFASKN
jgi:pyrroloquinoline quinone (PQQ) biosynthesis protein C